MHTEHVAAEVLPDNLNLGNYRKGNCTENRKPGPHEADEERKSS